jgi:uncharacterized protein YdeI (YjbR/CyaY-like superfamily)
MTQRPRVVFFKSAGEFRRWLETNHASAAEIFIGFYRKDSGRTGITYQEALDEALCFGWIDGVRKKVDDISYTNRFSPRRAKSIWSAVNTRRVQQLIEEGRVTSAGLKVFEDRDAARSKRYSYERERGELDPELRRRFRSNPGAWKFFEAQSPSYRRMMTWWILSARKDETRCRRLDALIADSAAGRRLGLLAPSSSRSSASRSGRRAK